MKEIIFYALAAIGAFNILGLIVSFPINIAFIALMKGSAFAIPLSQWMTGSLTAIALFVGAHLLSVSPHWWIIVIPMAVMLVTPFPGKMPAIHGAAMIVGWIVMLR